MNRNRKDGMIMGRKVQHLVLYAVKLFLKAITTAVLNVSRHKSHQGPIQGVRITQSRVFEYRNPH